MVKEAELNVFSFPDFPYPSMRDCFPKTGNQWIQGKIIDDGTEGLWRIHNNLYDFTNFTHPGGEFWLRQTKGTDITEAFESHHISTIPESLISKYFICEAKTLRRSPFTFENTGFYKTLKVKVKEELSKIPKNKLEESKRIADALTLSTFILAIICCRIRWIFIRLILCIITGLVQSWTVVCGHNFSHQKDNWRMYIFNLNFIPTREWRIGHALSHHLYPNTLLDYEINIYEPYFLWFPRSSKTLLNKYGPRVYAFIIYIFSIDANILKFYVFSYKTVKFQFEDLVPLTIPLSMYLFGGCEILETLIIWICIVHAASFFFQLIGVNSAHHHPDIFHDGDDHCSDRDWGLHQIEAVMDRVDINGSLFKVLTHFGDHCLHHLFPTLDHALLPKLYPVFAETCNEFHTKHKMTTQLQLFIGQFQQIARTEKKKL